MADLVNRIKQRLPYECLKKGSLTKQGVTVSKRGAPKPSIRDRYGSQESTGQAR